MERFLSTVFPCCFSRRSRGEQSHSSNGERTPLLQSRRGSSSSSSSANGKLKSASIGGSRSKNKSVLPAPRYNAAALRTIVDDLKSKVIPLDSSTPDSKLPQAITQDAASGQTPLSKSAKPVTPVHSLKLNIPPTSPQSSTGSSKTRLVDIWSPSPLPSTSGSTTPISYASAAQKAKFAKQAAGKRKPSPANTKQSSLSVEQQTFETLAHVARSKPLVHAWDMEDEQHLPA